MKRSELKISKRGGTQQLYIIGRENVISKVSRSPPLALALAVLGVRNTLIAVRLWRVYRVLVFRGGKAGVGGEGRRGEGHGILYNRGRYDTQSYVY